jgi:hypothetical protein
LASRHCCSSCAVGLLLLLLLLPLLPAAAAGGCCCCCCSWLHVICTSLPAARAPLPAIVTSSVRLRGKITQRG